VSPTYSVRGKDLGKSSNVEIQLKSHRINGPCVFVRAHKSTVLGMAGICDQVPSRKLWHLSIIRALVWLSEESTPYVQLKKYNTTIGGSRMEFQVHTTTGKRWPVLLTFLFIGLLRLARAPGVSRDCSELAWCFVAPINTVSSKLSRNRRIAELRFGLHGGYGPQRVPQ